jgi:hypothetical protein
MQNRPEGRCCEYMRSVVVRIVLAMSLGFNLSLSISIGRNKAAQTAFVMSDKAKQLADEANKRDADQQIKSQLQLHKAGVLRSKGHAFWNNFAIVFREEYLDFNNLLTSDARRIESFDDRSEIYKVKLHAKSGAHAVCTVDIEGQQISASGEQPGSSARLKINYKLCVDDEDNIIIRNNAGGGGGYVSESDFVIEVLRFFAQ